MTPSEHSLLIRMDAINASIRSWVTSEYPTPAHRYPFRSRSLENNLEAAGRDIGLLVRFQVMWIDEPHRDVTITPLNPDAEVFLTRYQELFLERELCRD